MRTRTVARTGALNLAAQVAILGVLYVTAHERPLGVSGVGRALLLLVATLVPSAIWAVFFYLQDRRQPEPTANVVMAFAAGIGAGAALILPAESELFRPAEWMHRTPASLIAAATLVRGALVAAVLYVVIRYGFMPSADFDEPADGLAYGAFAGSGLAASLSLSQTYAHPDFTLFSHAYTAATNVLAYASIGALGGYLVGRAKFQLRSASLSYAEALVAVAALTGLYHVVAEYSFIEESANAMWISLAATLVFAVAVLALATWLMYRLTSRSDHRSRPAARRLDPLPAAVAAVLIASGAFAAWRALVPAVFQGAGVTFRYDRSYVASVGSGQTDAVVSQASFGRRRPASAHAAGEPIFSASGPQGVRVSVRRLAESAPIDQLDPLPLIGAENPASLTITEGAAGRRAALRVRYSYQLPREPDDAGMPRMRWVIADIVPTGAGTFVFALDAPPEAFGGAERSYEALLSTVRWP